MSDASNDSNDQIRQAPVQCRTAALPRALPGHFLCLTATHSPWASSELCMKAVRPCKCQAQEHRVGGTSHAHLSAKHTERIWAHGVMYSDGVGLSTWWADIFTEQGIQCSIQGAAKVCKVLHHICRTENSGHAQRFHKGLQGHNLCLS